MAEGRITDIGFYGDFLSVCALEPLTEALRGCPFRREDVSAALARFDLAPFFGTITEDEVLDTLFYANS